MHIPTEHDKLFCQYGRFKNFLSSLGAERLVSAVFKPPLCFCGSLLTGCLFMKTLQLIQNAAGKVLMRISYLNVFPLYWPSVKDNYLT